MTRRSFLKLGALFAAAMAIESNSVLSAAAKLAENNLLSIMIYKIWDRKKGRWNIKGTKYKDLDKNKLSRQKYDPSTFTVLWIGDNEFAEQNRRRLWNEHNIVYKYPSFPLDIEKATRFGNMSKPVLGQRWKQKILNNDPYIKDHYLYMNMQSQKTFREFPELLIKRNQAVAIGVNAFLNSMSLEERKEYYLKKGAKFSEWCKLNPELASNIGKKRAIKAKEWFSIPENAEIAREWQSRAGKIGGVNSAKKRMEDPVLYQNVIMKGAYAGGAKSAERKKDNTKRALQVLPITFSRLEAYKIVKSHNITTESVNTIIKDSTLSEIVEILKRPKGSGRGGKTIIYKKLN